MRLQVGIKASVVLLLSASVIPAFAAAPRQALSEPSTETNRLLAAAKEKGEQELDLVWSATSLGGSEGAKKFEALFNKMYGTSVKFNFTPGPSMTDMTGKITQEVSAGQKTTTDILIGTESHYGELLTRNVLEEYDYTKLSRRIKRELVAPRNIGVEFYTLVSGITYHTNFVAPSEVPRKLEDVLNPKWKGRIASTQNAAIFDRVALRPEWGIDKMKGFLAKLAQHIGGLIRASENERVITGEFVMLVLDGGGHQVRKQQAKGAPIGHSVPVDTGSVGFGYLGVPRFAAHPNLAKLFINLLESEAGQRVVFETHFTDHHELPGSQSAGALAHIQSQGTALLRVDIDFVTKHPEMRGLSEEFRKILRGK